MSNNNIEYNSIDNKNKIILMKILFVQIYKGLFILYR